MWVTYLLFIMAIAFNFGAYFLTMKVIPQEGLALENNSITRFIVRKSNSKSYWFVICFNAGIFTGIYFLDLWNPWYGFALAITNCTIFGVDFSWDIYEYFHEYRLP